MYMLSLKDVNVARLRRTLPCFVNTRTLGRGTFSAVFETPDPDRVLKLTTDKSHYTYLTDGLSPDSVHKPVVLHDHGEVGMTFEGLPLYLVELERLRPVRAGTFNGLLTRRLARYATKNPTGQLPTNAGAIEGITPSLSSFLEDLHRFITDFLYQADICWSNFMERADGTLVVNDPVFDAGLLCRVSKARYRTQQEARGYAYA